MPTCLRRWAHQSPLSADRPISLPLRNAFSQVPVVLFGQIGAAGDSSTDYRERPPHRVVIRAVTPQQMSAEGLAYHLGLRYAVFFGAAPELPRLVIVKLDL